MDFKDVVKKRRSIRKYLDVNIPYDIIFQIIDAGRLAPSAGNLQNWKFIVITDEDKRAKIADACLEQHWMAKAPVHILLLAEVDRIRKYYGVRGERLYGIQNCAAAAENMLLAATSLGLGSCWVGAFDEERIKDIIGLRMEEVRPQIILTMGYPDENPPEPDKYRMEIISYLHRWRGRFDIYEYSGWFSETMAKKGREGKKVLKKVSEHVGKKGKEMIENLRKKIQK